MQKRLLGGFATALVAAAALSTPGTARAQYKNHSFGFDGGGWLIQKPSIDDPATGEPYAHAEDRPMRLSNGAVFGGETSFKLDADRWWFTGRVNIGFLRYAGEEEYDKEARDALGTLMGVEGHIGIRYFIFTDRVRPYLQLTLSYLRLMSFKATASAACPEDGDTFCVPGLNNSENYLPHPNVGALHARPGVEFIFSRDTAINVFFDAQRWILMNAPDNWAFVVGLGIVFYT